MRHRWASLVLLFCIETRNAPAESKIVRDWSKYPAIVQIDTSEDIFAIGDVHGDYDRLVKLLAAAKIIERPADPDAVNPEAVRWIAGKAVLVFTGDLIDKGPHSLQVVRLAASMRKAAAGSGGHVITLMGNHEAEFLADSTEKKVKDFAQDLRGAGLMPTRKSRRAVRTWGQFLLAAARCSRTTGSFARGQHRRAEPLRNSMPISRPVSVGMVFGSPQLVGANSMLEARIGEEGPGGKPWFEIEKPQRSAAQLLISYVAALGVNHLVQGHQHQSIVFEDGQRRDAGRMFQWHGLIFLIDVGMSEGVGDSLGVVLHIRHHNGEEAFVIDAEGAEMSLWKSQR